MDESVKVPWWKKTWVVVLACIFIPPAGVVMLWVNKSSNNVLRTILTIALVILTILYLMIWSGVLYAIVNYDEIAKEAAVAKTETIGETVAESKPSNITVTTNESAQPQAQAVTQDNSPAAKPELATIDSLSEKLKATIGESGPKTYGLTTGGGFSVVSVTKHDALTIGDNSFANCIDFQVYSTVDSIKKFVEKDAFFRVFDTKGNENTNTTTRVGANGDNASVIIESSQPLADAKFLVVGTFNPDYNNGNRQIIFEIQ